MYGCVIVNLLYIIFSWTMPLYTPEIAEYVVQLIEILKGKVYNAKTVGDSIFCVWQKPATLHK